ncbi:hypothetical protein AC1031_001822 [Aphanomyces cochlioides]|nr:hypothetical protein AC1031_001822 [Aphanomyces cochlioides]
MSLDTSRPSVMSMPLTPERYVQGPFSDPTRRASYAQRLEQNEQDVSITVDNAAGETTMPASQNTDPAWLQGMPQLPKPPRYDGTTAAAKKEFMQLYQEYWFQCASLRQLGFQSYVMPIGACIADSRRLRIAKCVLRKPVEEITEDGGSVAAVVENAVYIESVLLDTGADTSVVNYSLFAALRAAGVYCRIIPGQHHNLEPFMGEPVYVRDSIYYETCLLESSKMVYKRPG